MRAATSRSAPTSRLATPDPNPNPSPNPNPNPNPNLHPHQARDVLLDPGCHDMRPYALKHQLTQRAALWRDLIKVS